ncbi:hypothetical protein [Aeoliella mucimassa]|uniref:Uncharacterized protein n=1 Tax=Aeoliella mucimassa TaxID=2527972 RepID=A0A518AM17_9BACT|nr:hypothetical protein [Aeoliella mucimassa]QDU55764.1 hypothetical protein Pan181_19590 [Aeoliella mucimassa]
MRTPRQSVLNLAGCLVALLLVWGVVLPALTTQPQVEEQLDWLDERGIDPSAMFYTELDLKWSPSAENVTAIADRDTPRPPLTP